MIRPFPRAILLAAAIALAACDEDSTSPAGTPSTIVIRAYVDADGSASFNAGDVPVAAAGIALVAGTDSIIATTDASGLATFTVDAGSYTAVFLDAPPQGAVLSGALHPTVVAPFNGDSLSAEFRWVYLSTVLQGTLFRDENANDTYDPGTDVPAPAIIVTLYADTLAAPVGTTVTDAQGHFVFTGLRPGTYWLDITEVPDIDIVGGSRQMVVVEPAAGADLSLQFTGSIVAPMPIADARALPDGSSVNVSGVVTVPYNRMRAQANNFWVQDSTGGIQVFAADSFATQMVQLGDSIQVSGEIDIFSGEIQIANVTVTVLGAGTVPDPLELTGAEVLSRAFEGMLVQSPLLRVVSVGTVSGTTGSYNVNVAAPDGSTFVVRISGSTVGIPSTTWMPGQYYNVTGVQSVFVSGGGAVTQQIFPRFPADVEPAVPLQDIADARQVPDGDSVTVTGVVTVPYTSMRAQRNNFWVQDSTGGIQVFAADSFATKKVQLGDSVFVTGVIDVFSGEIEIVNVTVAKAGTGTVPAPADLTGAEVLSRQFEGMLVRADSLEVISVGSVSGSTGSYNVVVEARDGSQFTVRISGTPVGIPSTFWTVGSFYRVAGVQSVFVSGGGAVTPQIFPRFPSDAEAL